MCLCSPVEDTIQFSHKTIYKLLHGAGFTDFFSSVVTKRPITIIVFVFIYNKFLIIPFKNNELQQCKNQLSELKNETREGIIREKYILRSENGLIRQG